MPHLDEGTLQAWLDRDRSGMDEAETTRIVEHLATCEVCADALAELESSSDRVRSILALGDPPDVPAPDFEDVLTRAGMREETSRSGFEWKGLAWAASLVLALGVGWMGNELIRSGSVSSGAAPATVASAERLESDAEAAAPAADERGPAGEEAASDDGVETAPPVAVAPETSRAVSEAEEPVAADQAESSEPAEPPVAAAPTPPDVAAGRSPDGEPEVAAAAGADADAVALADADPRADTVSLVVRGRVLDEASGSPLASAQVFVSDLDVGVLTQQDGTFSLELPRGIASRGAPVTVRVQRLGYREENREIALGGSDTIAAEFQLEQSALALSEVVVTGSSGGAERRALANSVDRLAAEAGLGFQVATIPDAEVETIEILEGLDPVRVRVTQLLPDGGTVELVQAADPDGTLELLAADADSIVWTRRDGVLLEISGPFAADSLRVLLDGVR